MNVLLSVITLVTLLVSGMCGVLYLRLVAIQGQVKTQREQLDRIEIGTHAVIDMHEAMIKRVDQLATDVLQREIYQSADDRHEQAIRDARAGCGTDLLIQRHGLSSDEAALIFALHGVHKAVTTTELADCEGVVENTWTGEI